MSRVSRSGFIPPQLPSLTDQPPEGSDWIHEVKHEPVITLKVKHLAGARLLRHATVKGLVQ